MSSYIEFSPQEWKNIVEVITGKKERKFLLKSEQDRIRRQLEEREKKNENRSDDSTTDHGDGNPNPRN